MESVTTPEGADVGQQEVVVSIEKSLENHPLSNKFPVRLPVWWARRGAVGPHPLLPGVTGRFILLRHVKKFGRVTGLLAKVMRAPKELRRPLDDLNSLLWELSDGTHTFGEICNLLDATFHERVAPVVERSSSALNQLTALNFIAILDLEFKGAWPLGPGIDPSGELEPPASTLELDWQPIYGDEVGEEE